MIKARLYAYTLLNLLISTVICTIILSGCVHYIFIMLLSNNKLQKHFDYQLQQLSAKHYLALDLRNASYSTITICKAAIDFCMVTESVQKLIDKHDIKGGSAIISILNQEQNILYYLRQSITPTINHLHSYTLYRDDITHNSVALIEGLTDMQALIKDNHSVNITLTLKNDKTWELIFVPRNPTRA